MSFVTHQLSTMTKEGFLAKNSPSIFKGWQTRYFMLKGTTIFYYKDQDAYSQQKQPKGIINLEPNCIQRPTEKDKKRFFNVVSGRRTYHLRAASEAEAAEWIDSVNRSLAQASSKSSPDLPPPTIYGPGETPPSSNIGTSGVVGGGSGGPAGPIPSHSPHLIPPPPSTVLAQRAPS
eukprot:gnl/Spiro4/8381_TR4403_c0_g1_i1.p1 gnl/Spiro4/8381_TR4403_c0_g1~~gnl/Spiro4/8381_TR4403_c0_g1_i1.p1  ORF type:complete len:176 (+),score=20.53 gnl/Spiro4/8381_TR4403_c0_g1_i1:72-599(+)